jgi:hypothetical protein
MRTTAARSGRDRTGALRDVSRRQRRRILHAYELRIRGLDDTIARAAARWELFACPEVRDLVKGAGKDRFLVLYEGEWDQPKIWCHLLANAGYAAEPIGRVDETEAS